MTNDVLQMLGKPPSGKELEKMKPGNKVKREGLDTAIKLLCLCDTPEVRIAAHKWGRNLMAHASWKQMGGKTIQEVPSFGNLSPDTVYLVYLAPIHLQLQHD